MAMSLQRASHHLEVAHHNKSSLDLADFRFTFPARYRLNTSLNENAWLITSCFTAKPSLAFDIKAYLLNANMPVSNAWYDVSFLDIFCRFEFENYERRCL